MSIEIHLQEFDGLPVFEFPGPKSGAALPAAGEVAWRLQYEENWVREDDRYRKAVDETFAELWQRFLATVDLAQVRALVIGQWSEIPAAEVADLLIAAADRLTGLRALFFGDLHREESDLAHIDLCDLAPVALAYPGLEVLAGRGVDTFGRIEHPALRTLLLESSGLPSDVLANVLDSELPALERLELWLGVEEHGGDISVADLEPLLSGRLFPALRHLALENSELQDEIAAAVASAPVVARLESLSLALGTLSDEGAAALLAGQPLTHLRLLDLYHHFLSEEMVDRLRKTLEPAGVELDLDEPQEADEMGGEVWRYVANAE
ncbi:STM4015 family protein [Kitasatospora griseola]|uniref:STM4015 family protein n=1 Tax=Kitasatospora griseola TaxID=2064 RepID=UPI0038015D7A